MSGRDHRGREVDPIPEQIAYYRARAREYDEWFLRRGRYDRGAEANRRWFDEVEIVREALDAFRPAGDVLELACGTGIWTERLARTAERLTAVDAVEEMLSLNRDRVGSPRVDYVQADLFAWRPDRRYDAVFFGFWLSHVPPERFEEIWSLVAAALKPEGRFFFVDSRYTPDSTAIDHRLEGSEATRVTRRLNDGREFRIVKVFHERERLARRLADLGWRARVEETPRFFLYGSGERSSGTA
ncbi:MAG: methyltransferase domain-containing protein [Candidatus Eisenbacteria bacterium]|nr:methyltransferase domain-containing protein [Candidatus Latescibacterota bacterium]MBD3300983.1 methyltransferase domain-containing protein [Candidatus Eisenbacteria bacterium]